MLDENVLTIGFARRVPSYKRLTLMLNDPQRLAGLLLDPERPIQIVIAGKAHPADEGGKRLIQQMVRFADSEAVRRRIVFLPDYDMALARFLVQGCDVWLNNPLRPLEACGTSGMKVALNGGLNLSVRDGWWDEWYDGGNGWEIPTADGVEDPARRDELEASALYELIAKSVAPLFYDAGADGVPQGWVEMVRHGLRSLGPLVQADRMVGDYVTKLYAPAARASRALAADGNATPPATSPRGRRASARRGPGCGSSTSRPTAPSRPSARCSTSGSPPRSATCPPRTSASRWSTAASATTTSSSSRPTWPSPPTTRRSRRTRGSPARWNWASPARSATRSGSCRPTRCSPAAPTWAWSPTRRARRHVHRRPPLAVPAVRQARSLLPGKLVPAVREAYPGCPRRQRSMWRSCGPRSRAFTLRLPLSGPAAG